MTALTFPINPTLGQIYDAPNQVQYVFDGVKWIVGTLALGSNAAASAIAAEASKISSGNFATNAANSAANAAASAEQAASSASVSVSGGIRYDIDQSLTANEKTQAQTNIGLILGTTAQAWNADLDAITALSNTSGVLKKTAENTWELDTSTYLSGLSLEQITTALGYTPYNAANPSAYTTLAAVAAVGYATGGGSVTGRNTGDETSATIKSKLGISTLSGSNTGDETYTTIKSKLDISTLSGSNTGDETSATIKSKLGVSALSGSNTGDETASTIRTKLGVLTLSGSNTGDETTETIKSKLGITSFATVASSGSYSDLINKPPISVVGTDVQAWDADLTAIASLAETTGLLRKTSANNWVLDTSQYLTGITSSQITTALGYTPLPSFYGFALSADGTELYLTTGRIDDYSTSNFASWDIQLPMSVSIINNSLALTI